MDKININSITPYAKNARKHSAQQIQNIANSIKEFGFINPVIIDKNFRIVAGHGRVEAAKLLGLEELPFIQVEHLSPLQIQAYILADNRLAELSEWDNALLSMELKDLVNQDFDLSLIGFDMDDIKVESDNDEEEDKCPDLLPDDPTTKLNDIWILGKHRLMCGDSTQIESVEKLLNHEKIDMVFTDPPYGIDEPTDRRGRPRMSGVAKGRVYKKVLGDADTSIAIDAYNLCQTLDIPIMVWWGANYYCHALKESGNWLVWDKRIDEKNDDNNSDGELAWVQSNYKSVRIFRHLWKGMIKASEHGEARVHPTQKPVALAEWCFEKYDDSVINILDLFGGSGSTLIACEKTKRKCFMMELDPAYCDVIIQRWEKLTGKKATLLG